MKTPLKLLLEADFDVVGFGTNAVDYLVSVPAYPQFDTKVEVTEYTREGGGEAATTMVGLQRLGFRTAYVGRFGADDAGYFGRRMLVQEGVDVSHTEHVEGASTQIGFIIIDECTGERTVLWHRDKNLDYAPDDAPLTAATSGKILHLTPHDLRSCISMAKIAKKNGVIVSIDVDNLFDGIEQLLPMVDILTVNTEFSEKLTGSTNGQTALRELVGRFGCAIAGITLGSAGSILFCEGEFIETTAFNVPGGCKDTTGAGDAFRAGLLYGILSGETIEESARIANAVAALKCRELGARSGLPDKHGLEYFLKNSET